MGLDMYLEKKTFLYKGEYMPEEKRDAIVITKGGNPHPTIKAERINEVIEEVGYWRKANHIHNWFVQNVQKGVDDCGYYSVNVEKLRDLLNVCEEVLEHPEKADKLLPTSSGFFFGGTEYSDYYFEQVQRTYDIIMDVVAAEDYDTADYYYCSSW